MNKNIYGYGNPYNPDALKDLDKIKKEIEEEFKKEVPDKEKMLELKQREMLKGMELLSGSLNGRTYRGMVPW
jgi:hypothetical protein